MELKIKTRISSLGKKVVNFYIKNDGGKKIVQKANVGITAFVIACIVATITILRPDEDTSFVAQSSTALIKKEEIPQKQNEEGDATKANLEHLKEEVRSRRSGSSNSVNRSGASQIVYKAPQIVQRKGSDPTKTLPIGTRMIGKLRSGIDTREPNQLIEVTLPYGGSAAWERRIDRNSSLFGTISYPGKGEKVYINFHRGVNLDGSEFRIQAQALNPIDFSPGILGESHDAFGLRIAATAGLSMLSSISEVMVEKEVLGQGAFPTPKSTLRNALLSGARRGTEQEAQRRAEQIQGEGEYVIIEAGEELIVNLTETYMQESLEQ